MGANRESKHHKYLICVDYLKHPSHAAIEAVCFVAKQAGQKLTYQIDVVAKITDTFSQLRKAEQKIAQTILDDLDFASRASISELSAKADVSDATVTRLAKSLGCNNVRDLKMQLAKSVAVGERFLTDAPRKPTGINGVYESIHQSLTLNVNLITQKMLDKCLELFAAANQVLVFGVGGSSTIMATELQYRLFRLGVVATAYSDPLLMRMTASTIKKKDLVIGISMSGSSPDVCEAVEIAAQYGASVISITRAKTPLAKVAQVNLPFKIREDDYIFKPTAARYVMLAVIDVLVTELAVRNRRKTRENLRRLKQTVDQHRRGHTRLPLGD